MKIWLSVILMCMQYFLCARISDVESLHCTQTLKECIVSEKLLCVIEKFHEQYRNELRDDTYVYISIYAHPSDQNVEILDIYAYAEDPVFYNLLLESEQYVGYFKYKNCYCIIGVTLAEQTFHKFCKWTDSEKTFQVHRIEPFDETPDEPAIYQSYWYENNKFVLRPQWKYPYTE